MQTDDTERASVKLLKYKTLICTLYVVGITSSTIDKSATGELELASCLDNATRRMFVISAGFGDNVWKDSTQNAVTAAENRPVYTSVSETGSGGAK